jgi:DNA-binding transcriptional regulator YiaG
LESASANVAFDRIFERRPDGRSTIETMANFASILKEEISRIARKIVRAETSSMKKAVAGYRSEIAALKRRAQELERQQRRKPAARTLGDDAAAGSTDSAKTRFSAKGLASQRRRLGLSAHECGLLIGVSAQSIYNWEEGKARPRASHLPALAALRTLGKKTAASHLASLSAAPAR